MNQPALRALDQPEPPLDAEEPAPATLTMAGIWRHWGRGSGRRAVLRDVSLRAAPGTITCIRGRNGVGKTTLLRIATGILSPDSGLVTLDGLAVDRDWREYHRRIGFLSAGDRGLYARVSARRHLEYWVRVAFVARAERKSAVEETLERFHLGDLADRRADRMSQGQRQRLRIALATVHRPRVLLLDEPRNSLDGEGSEILAAAVRGIAADGGAVVWCAPVGEEQPVHFHHTMVLENGMLVSA